MNDFDFDALERKRIARNARYKKNGSKNRKCTLPQDHMSAAELKRRNGKMSTYNLNAPMDFETFKSMPLDLKKEYITLLRERFNASATTIAEDMLGVSGTWMRVRVQDWGMSEKHRRIMSREQAEAWKAFLNGPVSEVEVVAEEKPNESVVAFDPETLQVVAIPSEEHDKVSHTEHNEKRAEELFKLLGLEPKTEKTVPAARVNNGTLYFTGCIEAIAEKLVAFLGDGEYQVRVEFAESEEREERLTYAESV